MKNIKFRNSVAWLSAIVLAIILILYIRYLYCSGQLQEFLTKLNDPIAIFTFVLAISTVLLWLDTNGLRRQAAKQSEDMEQSLKIGKIAAEAANKSAEVAEKSLERLERPFLFIYDLTPVDVAPLANNKCIWFTLQNYGRFPAIIGLAKIVARITTNSEASKEMGFDYDSDLKIPPILAVGQTISNIIYYFPSAIEWETLADGRHIPKVKSDEVLLLDVMITYSGGLIKSHILKERWRYDIGERAFKPSSWKME